MTIVMLFKIQITVQKLTNETEEIIQRIMELICAFSQVIRIVLHHIYTSVYSILLALSNSFSLSFLFFSYLVSFAKSDVPSSSSFFHISILWLIVCLIVATSTLALSFRQDEGWILLLHFGSTNFPLRWDDVKVIAHFLSVCVWMWCLVGIANRYQEGLIAFSLFKQVPVM